MPRANGDQWIGPLNAAMQEWEIDSAQRMAAFLAQIAHESAQLTRLEENLSYTAERIRAVWPRRFPNDQSAQPYARNPERLANRVYSGRLGNGDEASGDGWRYRGRGLIQLTGRSNYASCKRNLDVDVLGEPDMLLQTEVAARSAGWFWFSRGLNELADHELGADDEDDFARITGIINPAKLGLLERITVWNQARSALGD